MTREEGQRPKAKGQSGKGREAQRPTPDAQRQDGEHTSCRGRACPAQDYSAPLAPSRDSAVTVAAVWRHGKEQLANAGVERPELDAEILLREALGISRASFFAHLRERVDNVTIEIYDDMVRRRAQSVPVQYILGRQEFMGLQLAVTPDVLIPRPETEILVELVIERLKAVQRPMPNARRKHEEPSANSQQPSEDGNDQDWARHGRAPTGETDDGHRMAPNPHVGAGPCPAHGNPVAPETTLAFGLWPLASTVADLGTGSGAIAVSLAKYLPNAHVVAVDISEKALFVAQSNAAKHKVTDQITFLQGDFLQPLLAMGHDQPLDAIVSNPPYIPSSVIPTLDGHVQSEPHLALDGGLDGLIFYRRLAQDAAALLQPEGFVAVEVGDDQAADVAELFRAQAWRSIEIHPDLAGIPRVVIAYRPESVD